MQLSTKKATAKNEKQIQAETDLWNQLALASISRAAHFCTGEDELEEVEISPKLSTLIPPSQNLGGRVLGRASPRWQRTNKK